MSFITTKERIYQHLQLKKSHDIAPILTNLGLEANEVPSSIQIDPLVIVGRVLSVNKHPNADRLNVCEVDVAQSNPLTIVCGCPSVVPGLVVPVAQVGAKLPELNIRKSKIRGVESHGMLCAPSELGFLSSRAGLYALNDGAVIGRKLSDHLNIPTSVYEIDITPNRGDCISDVGLARDLSAKLKTPMSNDIFSEYFECPHTDSLFEVEDEGVDVFCAAQWAITSDALKTPDAVLSELSLAGMRSIHPVIDVLHYVMLITGQPFHAYSREKVDGVLCVKSIDKGVFQTLSQETLEVASPHALVVKTDDKIGSLAGIIGSSDLGVEEGDSRFIIEAACFSPDRITAAVQHYGIHTDSSYRFTRGVDPSMTEKSLHYALSLLTRFFGGAVDCVQIYKKEKKKKVIPFTPDRYTRIIGHEPRDEWLDDLRALGFECAKSKTSSQWQIQVPSYRYDISEPIDLVEELLRLAGYDSIPDGHAYPRVQPVHPSVGGRISSFDMRQRLVGMGYREVVNYSFYSEQHRSMMGNTKPAIELDNPSNANLKFMRSSLLPSLLSNLEHYVRRQGERIKLFEWAPIYHGYEAHEQEDRLSGVCMGEPTDWRKQDRGVFTLKNEWFQLTPHLPQKDVRWDVSGIPEIFHPHASIRLAFDYQSGFSQSFGYIGMIHPKISQKLGLQYPVCAFDYPADVLLKCTEKKFQHPSVYPSVRRDLSLLIPEKVTFSQLTHLIMDHSSIPITDVNLFDVYDDGRQKIYSVAIRFQRVDRTLQDDEVHVEVERLIKLLDEKLEVSLKQL